MKRGVLGLLLMFLPLASAEVYSASDIGKYALLFYLSLGFVLIFLILIAIFMLKIMRKKLSVKFGIGKIGQEFDIEISPGKAGLGNIIQLFEENGVKIGEFPICQEQLLTEKKVLRYKIPQSWKPGEYKLKVYDSKEGWKYFWFEVK